MIELRFIHRNTRIHTLRTKKVPRVGDYVRFDRLINGSTTLNENVEMKINYVCWRYDLDSPVVEISGDLM